MRLDSHRAHLAVVGGKGEGVGIDFEHGNDIGVVGHREGAGGADGVACSGPAYEVEALGGRGCEGHGQVGVGLEGEAGGSLGDGSAGRIRAIRGTDSAAHDAVGTCHHLERVAVEGGGDSRVVVAHGDSLRGGGGDGTVAPGLQVVLVGRQGNDGDIGAGGDGSHVGHVVG